VNIKLFRSFFVFLSSVTNIFRDIFLSAFPKAEFQVPIQLYPSSFPLSSSQPAPKLPAMTRTLITGANGFVGATMIDECLKAGHTVTGCVRSKKSGADLVAIHPEWDASKIDFVEVADYTAEGVFDKIFQEGDYDYVLHIAAPMPDNPAYTDFETHFEKPSIQG
jgi:hypothetical protein